MLVFLIKEITLILLKLGSTKFVENDQYQTVEVNSHYVKIIIIIIIIWLGHVARIEIIKIFSILFVEINIWERYFVDLGGAILKFSSGENLEWLRTRIVVMIVDAPVSKTTGKPSLLIPSPQWEIWINRTFVVLYSMFRLTEPLSDIWLFYIHLYWSLGIPTPASVYILEYWFLLICNAVIYT
jgi:hypothetical protein